MHGWGIRSTEQGIGPFTQSRQRPTTQITSSDSLGRIAFDHRRTIGGRVISVAYLSLMTNNPAKSKGRPQKHFASFRGCTAQPGEASGSLGEGVRVRGGSAKAYPEKFQDPVELLMPGRRDLRQFGFRSTDAIRGDL